MIPCEFPLVYCLVFAIFAVILIGFSKAGLGGAVGSLTTPLLSLIFPAKVVIGFLLPLLIAADMFTVYHYWKEWDWRNLKSLIPGALCGIVIGALFIDRVSDVQLKRAIGAVVVLFVLYHFLRPGSREQSHGRPHLFTGLVTGLAAGFVSTIAHSAGVIVAIYLLAQNLPKRVYVATMVLFFTGLNLAKVIPYLSIGLITPETLKSGLLFVLFIPIGIRLGLWINRRLSQAAFINVIYVLVFLTALQLLTGVNFILLLAGK